jgi:cytosine/adenosine deaminase-related metal-dependent hydrolase
MLAALGTTTVADIEAVPELLPDVWSSTSLRVVSFLEMTSVRSRRDPRELLQSAEAEIKSLPHKKNRVGISPHALYSTTPDLLQLSAERAREKNWRVTTHVAESAEEFEMYQHGRGPLFDWLKTQREMSDCGAASPVAQLDKCGLLSGNFLAVHVNCLAPGDAGRLAQANSSVVHCPRSHHYFRHPPFPRAELAASGVNICLGTDSLASVEKPGREKPELNLFAEMQAFAKNFPEVTPDEILEMATRNGARALGMENEIGHLSENSVADLISIPFSGKISEAVAAVVSFKGKVASAMIEGEWVQAPAFRS